LEPALKELVKSGELSSVALLNATGAVVASAGSPIDLETKGMMQNGEHWDYKNVTLVNLVDLGASETILRETNRTTIVLPPRPAGSRPPAGPPPEGPPPDDGRPFTRDRIQSQGDSTNAAVPRSTEPRSTEPRSSSIGPTAFNSLTGDLSNALGSSASNAASNSFSNIPGSSATNLAATSPQNPTERRPPRPFRRPFGMSEQEYKSMLETRGLHGLVIALSTENFRRAVDQDLWMRWIISCFAGVSVAGLSLAWRNVAKSSELQMRLLRASELNSHLKEMNLAAAGLAHETRNPLNIIRGLAQMVSKQQDTAPEIRKKLNDIVDE